MSTQQNGSGGKNLSAFLLIALGVVLVGVALFFYFGSPDDSVAEDAVETVEAPMAGETGASIDIDVSKALAPRTLGAIDAPIKITEFSSLSCGHCAKFHETTMKDLKAKYIDTGKVRVVFSEFPLNRSALDGTMIARCLPADQYVEFTEMLFAKQEDWAFGENYQDVLTGYAKDYGMDKANVKACLDNVELREGIISKVQAAQKQWEIGSTPSFVVNNKTVINGVVGLEAFEAAFNETE